VGRGRAVADPGLVAGAGQGIDAKVGSEVGERARDGGDRDAPLERAVRRDDARAPHGDAGNAALERRADLRLRGRSASEQPEDVRGRAAAQARVVAARENRGQIARLDARSAVADAVHAPVHREQRAAFEPPFDLVARDAGVEQLRPGHHTVLLRGQPREDPFYRGRLYRHQQY